jgi:hypothetical protein
MFVVDEPSTVWQFLGAVAFLAVVVTTVLCVIAWTTPASSRYVEGRTIETLMPGERGVALRLVVGHNGRGVTLTPDGWRVEQAPGFHAWYLRTRSLLDDEHGVSKTTEAAVPAAASWVNHDSADYEPSRAHEDQSQCSTRG